MEIKAKYKFVVNEEKRTVVALRRFNGKVYRGVSKCSPNDTWDVEVGKKLAALRCEAKVAHCKLKLSEIDLKWTQDGLQWFQERVNKCVDAENRSIEYLKAVTSELASFEDSLA